MSTKRTVGTPFKKGDDSRRNTTGANKGSKWKSTLLKELLQIDLSNDELDEFNNLKAKFPSIFNSTDEKNFQLFMEIKQISLVFDKDSRVAQNAIDAIKDRIDGKPKQQIGINNFTPITGITFDDD